MAECEDDGSVCPTLTNAELVEIINENLALQAEAIASCCSKLADDVEKGIISSVSGVDKVCGKIEKVVDKQTDNCCKEVGKVAETLESSVLNILTETKIQNQMILGAINESLNRSTGAQSIGAANVVATGPAAFGAINQQANGISDAKAQEKALQEPTEETPQLTDVLSFLAQQIDELKARIETMSVTQANQSSQPSKIESIEVNVPNVPVADLASQSTSQVASNNEYVNVASMPGDSSTGVNVNVRMAVDVKPNHVGFNFPNVSVASANVNSSAQGSVATVNVAVPTNVVQSGNVDSTLQSLENNQLQPLLNCPPTAIPPTTAAACCNAYDPFADFFAWRFGPMTALQKQEIARFLRLPHVALFSDVVQLVQWTNAKEQQLIQQ